MIHGKGNIQPAQPSNKQQQAASPTKIGGVVNDRSVDSMQQKQANDSRNSVPVAQGGNNST